MKSDLYLVLFRGTLVPLVLFSGGFFFSMVTVSMHA